MNNTEKTTSSPALLIDGATAFALYDTYGFPYDLTVLIARENGFEVDEQGFTALLQQQKERSRNAAASDASDWIEVNAAQNLQFCGYDALKCATRIVKYRMVNAKGAQRCHIVLENTPFYGESGGQAGDCGTLITHSGGETPVFNTIKENGLVIHIAEGLPDNPAGEVVACVDERRRLLTTNHHTATHLLHHALRNVLGTHVEQKGSMVSADGLRFDFSHFQKMTDHELGKVEMLVNALIRENTALCERRSVPIEQARSLGAMALFGEKYGDHVRVIQFGNSVELCGGTHAQRTGQIGFFKILSESAVSAGVRRIEAVAGECAERIIYDMQDIISEIKQIFSSSDIRAAIRRTMSENADLRRQADAFMKEHLARLRDVLLQNTAIGSNGVRYVEFRRDVDMPADAVRELAFQIRANADIAFAAAVISSGKPLLMLALGDAVVERGLNAAQIVRSAAKHIGGSGGGQPFLATAGGKDAAGLDAALSAMKEQCLGKE